MSANPEALPGWFDRRSQDDHKNHVAPGENAAETQGTAHTTTGSGKDDQTPVVVWEAANRMEAEIVAGRLQSEGIPAIIRGEALGAIYGLTTGTLAAANVLVPAILAEKALAILTSAVEWDDGELGDYADADERSTGAPDQHADHNHNG